MVLEPNEAVMPAGRPVGTPIPVAPVVVWVMAVESALLIQTVGDEDAGETVLSGVTVIVPVAFTMLQPPVSGIV